MMSLLINIVYKKINYKITNIILKVLVLKQIDLCTIE